MSFESNVTVNSNSGDDISLSLLVAKLKRHWLFVILFAILSILLGAALCFLMPNQYRAEVLLAPNSIDESSAMSSLAGQFGGLASLAGINLGGGAMDKTQFALATLQSHDFLGAFVQTHQLKADLMATKSWDPVAGTATYDSDLYDVNKKTWIREVGLPRKSEPSELEVSDYLKDFIKVSIDKDSGFIRVSFIHRSAAFAKQFLDLMLMDLNKVIKQKDIVEIEQNLAFLREQADKTSISDVKSMFYKLQLEQTKSLMLAVGSEQYALKYIETAAVMEKPFSPNKPLIMAISLVIGLLIGAIYALSKD